MEITQIQLEDIPKVWLKPRLNAFEEWNEEDQERDNERLAKEFEEVYSNVKVTTYMRGILYRPIA